MDVKELPEIQPLEVSTILYKQTKIVAIRDKRGKVLRSVSQLRDKMFEHRQNEHSSNPSLYTYLILFSPHYDLC